MRQYQTRYQVVRDRDRGGFENTGKKRDPGGTPGLQRAPKNPSSAAICPSQPLIQLQVLHPEQKTHGNPDSMSIVGPGERSTLACPSYAKKKKLYTGVADFIPS
ncbi:hypothetical protein AAES_125302 [Amazona aestiva]|uniref:Uncharacterized protein n=1 Tax=Amazona aestiva TaxID=12930 RepID=A0A0Q3PN80_AMAAE|nr:hypothetical protein AAES_125302 [Amazona aestiva]